MLEMLNQRLKEMEGVNGPRRPSMWQHTSSTGSAHSSQGSIPFPSPQSLPPGPVAYRQPSVTAYNMTGYGEPSDVHQTSPPQHHYSSAPFTHQPMQPFEQYQPPVGHGNPAPQFDYSVQPPVERHPNFHVPPSQHFAAWGGHGSSAPGGPDTLDEENAVPPR
jgi:hypothetical protein